MAVKRIDNAASSRIRDIPYEEQPKPASTEFDANLQEERAKQSRADAEAERIKIHTVEKGDTLWDIARAENIPL